jgi:hypothetical protein
MRDLHWRAKGANQNAVPSKEQKTCCGEDTKLRLIRPSSISAFSNECLCDRELNMRSTRRFSDLSTPIRACINGLRSSAARINASIRCLPVGGFLTGGSKTFRPPTMSGGMKKVKFDNSQSIELQKALPGAELTPEQLSIMHIEGWLVDDHVCVQKPAGDAGWRVSLYPWGDRISGEFYFKADAVEYAKRCQQAWHRLGRGL